MENSIRSIVVINGSLKLILTTDEPLQQKVLEELDGATCKLIVNNKLDDELILEYGLILEKKLEKRDVEVKKGYLNRIINAILNK